MTDERERRYNKLETRKSYRKTSVKKKQQRPSDLIKLGTIFVCILLHPTTYFDQRFQFTG